MACNKQMSMTFKVTKVIQNGAIQQTTYAVRFMCKHINPLYILHIVGDWELQRHQTAKGPSLTCKVIVQNKQ